MDDAAILIEPEARNTAPAVLAAVLHIAATDPDAVILVAPSDHVISDSVAFRAAVERGVPAARAGRIVTFGIRPTHPETGYGWLELAQPAADNAVPLTRFVEKPDLASAQTMLAAGNFLWNAGIFLFSARSMLQAFADHAPDLLPSVNDALESAKSDLGFLRLDPRAWGQAASISIDYAVMERADNLSVVEYAAGWSDLGGWDAVAREMGADDAGVSVSGAVTAIDCAGTLLRSDSEGVELVGIGLKDLIVVAMNDAVLVVDRAAAPEAVVVLTDLLQTLVRDAPARGHRAQEGQDVLGLLRAAEGEQQDAVGAIGFGRLGHLHGDGGAVTGAGDHRGLALGRRLRGRLRGRRGRGLARLALLRRGLGLHVRRERKDAHVLRGAAGQLA